jgi:hypothetical protein
MKNFYFKTTGSLLLAAFIWSGSQLQAATNKYRLMLRTDPATSSVIGWNQVSGTGATVYYGTTDYGTAWASYSNSKTIDRSISYLGMNNCFARLTGLQANTVYYFVIKDSEGTSQRFSFKTLPNSPTQRLSIIAGGDSRNNRTPRQNANRLVAKLRPHAVMFGGDMTDTGTNTQWAEWFDDWQLTIASDGRMFPVIAARGNHESSNAIIENLFDVPSSNVYYALTLGGSLVRAYTLNTEITISGSQTTWLSGDLSANNNVTWKIAQYHKPMRPHEAGKAEGNNQYTYWSGLFQQYGVKLVVESDAHTVKTTWPLVPSTAAGNDMGFVRDDANGSVYVGEGCWGAPLRSNNDDKSWTRNSGMFNHFNWVFIDQTKIEVRTINVDNASSVSSVSDANIFSPPANLNIWTPSNGALITISNQPINQAPNVSITAPANSTHYAAVQQITLTASASDVDGTITNVEFYNNGTLIASDATAPYAVTWTIPSNGSYALTAKATDNSGNTKTSTAVNITCGSTPISFSKRVVSGNDDVEESQTGAMYMNSSDLELVNDGTTYGNQKIGMRFTGITVPQGASISNAYIQFTCDETGSTATSLTIKGENVNNSAVFTTASSNVSSRAQTAASVAWAPAAWSTVGQASTTQRTPDIKTIIQEIVNRTGWVSGNALSIIITGTGKRTAEAYEGSSTQAPLLVIEYSNGTSARIAANSGNQSTGLSTSDEFITEVSKLFKPGAEVKIYPNPFGDLFTIELANLEEGKTLKVLVYDAQGKVCVETTTVSKSNNTFEINMSGMPSGTYFLKAEIGLEKFYRRIVKR